MFRVFDAVPAFARPTRAALYAGAALASVLLAAAAPPVMAQTAGDDRITNTETLVVDADRDFGAGDDLFTNKGGVVRFAEADAPLNIRFLNLERFSNEAGLIDLRNARAGDTLTLSGDYSASGDARLALDVSGDTVDRLIVTGEAKGRTTILLQGLDPAHATLMDERVALVSVGEDSAANAFRLGDADIGLVRYGLTYDDDDGAYMLDASAGRSVHQSLRAVEGLRTAWRASAEAFGAEQAMARAAGGESGRIWAQAHGALVELDGNDAAFALDYEQSWVGGQMGASLGARTLFGGQAAFGVTAGYVNSSLDFANDGQVQDIQTFNAGLYTAWRRDKLFATGLVKVDRHSLDIEDAAAGFSAELDASSWGAQLEAGYRFDLGGVAFEPVIGLDYLSTSIDDLAVLDQSVLFEDRAGLSGRLGGQAVSRREYADGRALLLSAGLEYVREFDTEQEGALHSNGLVDEVRVEGPESLGRATLGAQLDMGGGLQTFIQGEGRFGDGSTGGGLRFGARYRF